MKEKGLSLATDTVNRIINKGWYVKLKNNTIAIKLSFKGATKEAAAYANLKNNNKQN